MAADPSVTRPGGSALQAARALRDDLRERGVDAEVTVAADRQQLEVVARIVLPLGLDLGRPAPSTVLIFAQRVDPGQVGPPLADYLADRIKREVVVALLRNLLPIATDLGVHRQALAPFAREVIGYVAERVPPAGFDPGQTAMPDYWVRYLAAPFTNADGKGDR